MNPRHGFAELGSDFSAEDARQSEYDKHRRQRACESEYRAEQDGTRQGQRDRVACHHQQRRAGVSAVGKPDGEGRYQPRFVIGMAFAAAFCAGLFAALEPTPNQEQRRSEHDPRNGVMQVEAADIAVLVNEHPADRRAKRGDGTDSKDLPEEVTADVL